MPWLNPTQGVNNDCGFSVVISAIIIPTLLRAESTPEGNINFSEGHGDKAGFYTELLAQFNRLHDTDATWAALRRLVGMEPFLSSPAALERLFEIK